jgi:2-polyprenyl-3-methyl-5-hydroxy-6-metoxy-1,4-benzoquinol methylase
VTGVTYSPLSNTWRKAADTDVNYMLVSRKAG